VQVLPVTDVTCHKNVTPDRLFDGLHGLSADVRRCDSKDWVMASASVGPSLLPALCLTLAGHCSAGREGMATCMPMTRDKGRLRRLRLVHYIHCHVQNNGKL